MFKKIFSVIKAIFENGDLIIQIYQSIKDELQKSDAEVRELENELLNPDEVTK